MNNLVPTKVFLTKGVGRHKYQLKSFEQALRKAGVAHLNLVTVSSILPPKCKIIRYHMRSWEGRAERKWNRIFE